MYSIDEFQDISADGIKGIELPLEGIPQEWQALGLSRATFRYGLDWSSRISLEVEGKGDFFNLPQTDISLGPIFPDQKFINISRKVNSNGNGLLTFVPKFEPFIFGSPLRVTHAKCIVINGPSTHFEGGALTWEADGMCFQYSLFPGVMEALGDKERMSGVSIPTGVLAISFSDNSSLDTDDIWKIFHRASKVLGSRLVNFQSQKMTVAARATADRKTFGHLS